MAVSPCVTYVIILRRAGPKERCFHRWRSIVAPRWGPAEGAGVVAVGVLCCSEVNLGKLWVHLWKLECEEWNRLGQVMMMMMVVVMMMMMICFAIETIKYFECGIILCNFTTRFAQFFSFRGIYGWQCLSSASASGANHAAKNEILLLVKCGNGTVQRLCTICQKW